MSGSRPTKGWQRAPRRGPCARKGLHCGVAGLLALMATMLGEPGAAQDDRPPHWPNLAQAVARHERCQLVVEVSPAAARVCDDLALRVSVRHPKELSLKDVKLGNVPKAFLLRESHNLAPQAEGDALLSQRLYVLEPLQAGQVAVGPIEVTVMKDRPGDSGEVVLRAEPIPVELETVVALPARLEDLRPAARLWAPAKSQPLAGPWRWAGALGLAIALLAGLVWRWARKHAAAASPVSPQREARRRLAELACAGHAPADVKAFYVALADIVRQYLVEAAGVPALAQTSEECLQAVAQCGVFPPAAAATLARFFRLADLVKFARWQPPPGEIGESLRQVELVIEAPLNDGRQGPGAHLPAESTEAAA